MRVEPVSVEEATTAIDALVEAMGPQDPNWHKPVTVEVLEGERPIEAIAKHIRRETEDDGA